MSSSARFETTCPARRMSNSSALISRGEIATTRRHTSSWRSVVLSDKFPNSMTAPEGRSRPPQKRPQSCRQFLHREWLEKIVIAAAIEPRYPIVNAVACRQDQDGRGDAALAQLGDDIEAIAIRQTQVQDDRVICASSRCSEPVFGSHKGIDVKAECTQSVHDGLSQTVVVFHQKNTHGDFPH